MLNVVIFGAPGSGKGTQSDNLIKEYGLYHISTGDVLRDHISRGTELGVIADSFISKGQLIPDELIIKILDNLLTEKAEETKDGVILDGFPRTIPQAEALSELLASRGATVNAVVGLEVPDEELVQRLLLRGKVSGRSDDNLETITKRLEVYHVKTAPLEDFYKARNLYFPINGSGSIEDIFDRIREAVNSVK